MAAKSKQCYDLFKDIGLFCNLSEDERRALIKKQIVKLHPDRLARNARAGGDAGAIAAAVAVSEDPGEELKNLNSCTEFPYGCYDPDVEFEDSGATSATGTASAAKTAPFDPQDPYTANPFNAFCLFSPFSVRTSNNCNDEFLKFHDAQRLESLGTVNWYNQEFPKWELEFKKNIERMDFIKQFDQYKAPFEAEFEKLVEIERRLVDIKTKLNQQGSASSIGSSGAVGAMSSLGQQQSLSKNDQAFLKQQLFSKIQPSNPHREKIASCSNSKGILWSRVLKNQILAIEKLYPSL